MFRTDDFSQVATIPVGNLPHGVWPSGDGTRIYVGLENDDALAAIDTATNKVIADDPDRPGAAGDRLCAECRAEPRRPAEPAALGVAGQVAQLALAPKAGASRAAKPPTSVSLFDQGLMQVLQASVTGLEPKQKYVLALADQSDGSGPLQPLAAFMTNPAGSAIVNAPGRSGRSSRMPPGRNGDIS